MPEYLSPGVYVEEISTGPKPIEGVSTSTAGFVGPTERGPTRPRLVTSWLDFQRWFGSYLDPEKSYLPYGIQGFFQNGGQRVFVARVLGEGAQTATATFAAAGGGEGDGPEATDGGSQGLVLSANGPGAWGQNLLVRIANGSRSRPEQDADGNPAPTDLFRVTILFYAKGIPSPFIDPTQPANRSQPGYRAPDVFEDFDNLSGVPGASNFVEKALNAGSRLVVASFSGAPVRPANAPFPSAAPAETGGDSEGQEESPPEAAHGQFQFPAAAEGADDGSEATPSAPSELQEAIDALEPLDQNTSSVAGIDSAFGTAVGLLTTVKDGLDASTHAAEISTLDAQITQLQDTTGNKGEKITRRDAVVAALETLVTSLGGSGGTGGDNGNGEATATAGGDGAAITPQDFEGNATAAPDERTGLAALAAIDEISLVVVPDHVNSGLLSDEAARNALTNSVVDQCELLKDRFAVLSEERGRGQVQDIFPVRDTTYGAVYYPWIRVFDARTQDTVLVPPSGHVTGIYARSDIDRGVHKAPANEVVRGIITTDLSGSRGPLEYTITKGEHDILNPRGINVIRDFRSDRRGIRVWGARTMSSDPEWRYVNVRRLFLFIEESIDEGTQWVVFEPNYEPTWARVRRSVGDFLNRVWRDGALRGLTQEEAFFVRCDRTTMTEDDIDNGRLICYIGVAPVKPAEFVIFRIGQKTLEANE